MERVPEKELMDDPVQVAAYAKADFSKPDNFFVEMCLAMARAGGYERMARYVDLGCGPGNITLALAEQLPGCIVHGIDASRPMLDVAVASRSPVLARRVDFLCEYLPFSVVPNAAYDAVISNSFLHHLPDPAVLWQCIARIGRSGAMVMVMDLVRPASHAEAETLVQQYAGDEPDVLRQDFLNSLCAAFTPEEVLLQLEDEGLSEKFEIERVSDRHMMIAGWL